MTPTTMFLRTILLALAYFGSVTCSDDEAYFLSYTTELINRINNQPGITWTAGPSKTFRTFEEFRQRLGARREHPEERRLRRPTMTFAINANKLPTEFDARKQWTQCSTIRQIRDQSSCGSCWAFGAVEAMSDRLCIHSNGTVNVELSAVDLLSCCRDCGDGCEGGWPGLAWDFWKNEGIVTGGSKEANTGCQPYPFPSCRHIGPGTKPDCPKELYNTPKCYRVCVDGYRKPYMNDKYSSISSYNIHPNEDTIKMEIMTNGPVEAEFDVYEDFIVYEKGIYQHTKGTEPVGGHAIRILGWGVENKVPYWLIANSWNDEWGENGYFRMIRGKNECGIEADVVAGIPQNIWS